MKSWGEIKICKIKLSLLNSQTFQKVWKFYMQNSLIKTSTTSEKDLVYEVKFLKKELSRFKKMFTFFNVIYLTLKPFLLLFTSYCQMHLPSQTGVSDNWPLNLTFNSIGNFNLHYKSLRWMYYIRKLFSKSFLSSLNTWYLFLLLPKLCQIVTQFCQRIEFRLGRVF